MKTIERIWLKENTNSSKISPRATSAGTSMSKPMASCSSACIVTSPV